MELRRDTYCGLVPLRDGVISASNEIEIRFFFSKLKLIPPGVPELGKLLNPSLEAYKTTIPNQYIEISDHKILKSFRPKFFDKQTPVANNAEKIHAGLICCGLQNNGFILTNLYFKPITQTKRAGEQKFEVLTTFKPLSFRTPPQVVPVLPKEIAEILKTLASMTWERGQIWDNIGRLVSINLNGYTSDYDPMRSIVVQDGNLQVSMSHHLLSLREEAEISYNPAFMPDGLQKVDPIAAKAAS